MPKYARLVPHLAKAFAARPAHEQERPSAIVRVVPEVVEPQIGEDILHELQPLQTQTQLFALLVPLVGGGPVWRLN